MGGNVVVVLVIDDSRCRCRCVYVCVVLCCLRVHVREKSPKAQGDNDQELGSPATSSVIVESDWQMTIKL